MIHIYHPSKSIKGFACSFWYSHRDDSFYATLIKQAGWDEKTQRGTFKDSLNDPTKKVSIKLSDLEICGILDCIDRNRPFSSYHQSEGDPKQISFGPWMTKVAGDIDDNTPAKDEQKGYSFSISVGKNKDSLNKFYIGLSYAEGRYIREFILGTLQAIFRNKFEGQLNNGTSEPSNSLVNF